MNQPAVFSWQPVIKPPPLLSGQIHLWLAQVDETGSLAEQMQPLLNDNERQRAERYLDRRARLVFTAARGILRTLLGAYKGCLPREVALETGGQGKPRLASEQSASGLEFNLAHSSWACLFGFAHGDRLGVDLEIIRPLPEANRLAQRFFHPVEVGYLAGLRDEERLPAFYRIWTLKEAVLKAEGSGLWTPLNMVRVISANGDPVARVAIENREGAPTEWELREIPSLPGFFSALACKLPPADIRTFTYIAAI